MNYKLGSALLLANGIIDIVAVILVVVFGISLPIPLLGVFFLVVGGLKIGISKFANTRDFAYLGRFFAWLPGIILLLDVLAIIGLIIRIALFNG